jgi:uncharacterized protein YndB with AHSA1/START domain
MEIDIMRHVGAVEREVGSRDRDGRTVRVVTASRVYPTVIDDLWDAITSAERIPRWFLPVSGDLRLGGRFQLEGNAGGDITGCDPPRSLSLTWEFGGEVSWVDVLLSEGGEGATRLELQHAAPLSDDRWREFGPGAVGVGWDLALMGLGRHLESAAPVDREAVGAWMAGQGRDFMRRSSEAWGEASIQAGTDEASARAAAARTSAAYAGVEEPAEAESGSDR